MIINRTNLDKLFTGFDASFKAGMLAAPSLYQKVAMTVPSSTAENLYAWLGQIPRLREWLGDRRIKALATNGFSIKNRLFETTVEIPRTDIEDDTYGVFGPIIQEMGRASADHPDELVFSLLAKGFTSLCYDGQNFFDTEHPAEDAEGHETLVSNVSGDGSNPAWFLLDTSRAVKPMIFQKRTDYELQKLDDDHSYNVVMRDIYTYGVRGRANAGFGLWQLAHGSTATLNAANYSAARQQMMGLRGDRGHLLGVTPNVLVVPPALETAGLDLLKKQVLAGGEGNIWADTAELVVANWLAE